MIRSPSKWYSPSDRTRSAARDCRGRRCGLQILPTRSSDGASVFCPRRPLRRAHFARMRATYCAACTLRSSSWRRGRCRCLDLDDLDPARRVDHEGAAVGQALLFDQHVEIARKRQRRVADQRILHLPDRVGGVVPGLVREVRVGGDAVDLHAQLLEFRVAVGQIAEFGRANEREVGRVEHEHGPLALQVLVA